jgi:4-hydroxybenzoate polyprenyltransferase
MTANGSQQHRQTTAYPNFPVSFVQMNPPYRPLPLRLLRYQAERFPLLAHGLLIAAFTFSSISYARLCRGAAGFIPWQDYIAGFAIVLISFLHLRIYDEHKDAADDRQFRPELPVPRGLVSLRELAAVGWIGFGLQVALIAWRFPSLAGWFLLPTGFALLMRYEFFVPDWLKRNWWMYVVSHALVVPLIDFFASSIDWGLSGAGMPAGMWAFYGVSLINAILLEVGRKLRAPEQEAPGVLTYSSLYGPGKAALIWLGFLVLNTALAVAAATVAHLPFWTIPLLILTGVAAAGVGFWYRTSPTPTSGKAVETAAGLWTLLAYLTLGGLPMLL